MKAKARLQPGREVRICSEPLSRRHHAGTGPFHAVITSLTYHYQLESQTEAGRECDGPSDL